MKKDNVRNQLKAVRTRLGLSQQELATKAGVARQTIGGIEAGTYALSLGVALHLARTLGCPVEELFWLEDDLPIVEATPLTQAEGTEPIRVALARIGERWVASPLVGEGGYRREMIPADGLGTPTGADTLTVRLLDAPQTLAQTVLMAGCTPALSLWARSAERWHPGLRVHWLHLSSMAGLDRLKRGDVHLAGVHLLDTETGRDNRMFVREALSGTPAALVNLGVWQEGFVVAPGNPKRLRSGADLAQDGVRLINREVGAGSRLLLDGLLRADNIPATSITGYADCAGGHLDVAQAVREGHADVGVSTEAVAASFGLGFVPLRAVRYDLALRRETLALPAVQQLIATLHHRWVRTQLATLGGYDTTQTGEIVEVD